jgi:RNA polymerase sigma factor (sigma-70 family)
VLAYSLKRIDVSQEPMATLDQPEIRESLNRLLKTARPRLERVLRHFEIPPEDAEDILQDAQLTLLYKWDKIRSPESWLIGTVKKKCIMYWRKRRGSLCDAVDTAILELVSVPQPPEQERTELSCDLNRVLARLSVRCRSLLKLRYGLGYGPNEVAEQMGYRVSSIRKVTNRCLAALTRQLLAVGFQREPQDG